MRTRLDVGILFTPRVEGEFRVKDATLYRELLQKQLQSIASINVVHKENAFPFHQLEAKHDVSKKKFVNFRCPEKDRLVNGHRVWSLELA